MWDHTHLFSLSAYELFMIPLVKREGRGCGTSCEGTPTLSADVNSVASALVVLACECRELR